MNEKTAKLLKRYATRTKSDPAEAKSFYKELKQDWDRLNAAQRRKRRHEYTEALRADA